MIGYSSEISYHGQALLVQTQDKGLAAQSVETQVYLAGRIVHSQTASYSQFLNQPGFKDKVARLLKMLHESVLNDITTGKLDHLLLKPKA